MVSTPHANCQTNGINLLKTDHCALQLAHNLDRMELLEIKWSLVFVCKKTDYLNMEIS